MDEVKSDQPTHGGMESDIGTARELAVKIEAIIAGHNDVATLMALSCVLASYARERVPKQYYAQFLERMLKGVALFGLLPADPDKAFEPNPDGETIQ